MRKNAACLKEDRHVLNTAFVFSPMMQCCRNVPSCVRNAAGGGYRMASVSSFPSPSLSAYMHQKSQNKSHNSVGRVVPVLEKGLSVCPTPFSCLVIMTFEG